MSSSRMNVLVPGSPLNTPSFHLTSQIPSSSPGKPCKITQFIFRNLELIHSWCMEVTGVEVRSRPDPHGLTNLWLLCLIYVALIHLKSLKF